MTNTGEGRRKAGRRKKTRRMHDALNGKATEQEKQRYDKLLWSRFHDDDRRAQERRSGEERREGDEAGEVEAKK